MTCTEKQVSQTTYINLYPDHVYKSCKHLLGSTSFYCFWNNAQFIQSLASDDISVCLLFFSSPEMVPDSKAMVESCIFIHKIKQNWREH